MCFVRNSSQSGAVGIKSKCESEPMCTYLQCPVDYSSATSLFAPDGLHFSEEGHTRVAQTLVPMVLKVLGVEKANEHVNYFGSVTTGSTVSGIST